MEVDEMIETVERTLQLLRRNLDLEAERHYDIIIYAKQGSLTKTEQYATVYATEELEVIDKLETMLNTLDEVF